MSKFYLFQGYCRIQVDLCKLVHWMGREKLLLQMLGRLINVGEVILHEALFVALSMTLYRPTYCDER